MLAAFAAAAAEPPCHAAPVLVPAV
jgi:hypothetical protein